MHRKKISQHIIYFLTTAVNLCIITANLLGFTLNSPCKPNKVYCSRVKIESEVDLCKTMKNYENMMIF